MTKQKTVLVVDDEEFIRLNLKRIFTEEKYRVLTVSTGKKAMETVKKEDIDLALLDLNLPDMHGIKILEQMKKIQPDLLVIVVTGFASVESAVEAIKLGAYDYIKKPFKADAIKLITRLALETQSLKRTVKRLREEQQEKKGIDLILGSSSVMAHVKHQISEYARHGTETVLITGESGSGKELVASALHTLSPRAEKEFIEVNCASIPETLLESELFGYEKGAFTDAKNRKIGLFERADEGTLFLDEIGEMSLSLQAKLLRVLENKKFRRLGSVDDIEVSLRIIAATNKNLKEAIINKEFREDLYYRLNVLRIEVPPLRERPEDISVLAEFFLDHFNRKFNKKIMGFSIDTKRILLQYGWPGNVRELKNIMERICILQKESVIEMRHLPGELINAQLESGSGNLLRKSDFGGRSFDEIMKETEIRLLEKAYTLSDKNTSKAARLLKIPRETLRYKISKFNIGNGDS
ncbi:MAG: sigma-54-dependent transcriptional regulator [Calditrichaceae bacterium]